MRFSSSEVKELAFAGAMISLAFAILLSGGYRAFLNFSSGFVLVFIFAFFTAGIGFLLHELMHKYLAQNYGLQAEFRAFHGMLWLALLFSFAGFIFAAPGAVFIRGFLNKEKNGKISLAGPATNIVLALAFLILIFIFKESSSSLASLLKFGLEINALLAAFNMIPVNPFDGSKVLAWNKAVYFVTLALGIGLFVVSWIV